MGPMWGMFLNRVHIPGTLIIIVDPGIGLLMINRAVQ